jgi:L-phenylalanine/L-methionine N-acetyltransferase
MNDITVRKIHLEDTQGFWNALSSVAKEKKYILTVEPPPFESTRAFVKDNVEKNHAQYVAVCDKKIVGWADIIPFDHPTMNHVGGLGMGVIADFRGQGIGSKLLASVIQHAWANGLKRLELEVFADNEVAIALYKKHGFVQEGVKRFARVVDGHYQNIIVMAQYRV